jgi:WD40 repeat protein
LFLPDDVSMLLAEASGEESFAMSIYDVRAGTSQEVRDGAPFTAVSVSPDGATLALGLCDGRLELYDVRQRKPIAHLKGHTKPITAIAWSNDGARVASACWGGTVKLWDAKTGKTVREYHFPAEGNPLHSLFFAGSTHLVGSCAYGRPLIWDLKDERAAYGTIGTGDTGQPNELTVSAFDSSSGTLAVANGRQCATYSLPGGRLLQTRELPYHIGAMAFSWDGKSLAVGYGDIRSTSNAPANAGIIEILPISR